MLKPPLWGPRCVQGLLNGVLPRTCDRLRKSHEPWVCKPLLFPRDGLPVTGSSLSSFSLTGQKCLNPFPLFLFSQTRFPFPVSQQLGNAGRLPMMSEASTAHSSWWAPRVSAAIVSDFFSTDMEEWCRFGEIICTPEADGLIIVVRKNYIQKNSGKAYVN